MSYIDNSTKLLIEAIIIKGANENLTHWELQERLTEAGFESPELFDQIDAAYEDAMDIANNDPELDMDEDGFDIVIVPRWWASKEAIRAGFSGMTFEMTAPRSGSVVRAVYAA